MNQQEKATPGKNNDVQKKEWAEPKLALLDMEDTHATVGSNADGATAGPPDGTP